MRPVSESLKAKQWRAHTLQLAEEDGVWYATEQGKNVTGRGESAPEAVRNYAEGLL